MNPKNTSLPSTRPFTVVLTGGIAAGKTTVSDHFNSLGVPVIDTDEIAKKVVHRGQSGLDKIVKAFGPEILLSDGNLNRKMMRDLIFDNEKAKQRLESILHPEIEVEVIKKIENVRKPYCILVIPLFAESKNYKWVDRILLIDTPEKIQIDRVTSRDEISREQAEKILENQANRHARLSICDDVIRNDGSVGSLHSKVNELHHKYLQLANQK